MPCGIVYWHSLTKWLFLCCSVITTSSKYCSHKQMKWNYWVRKCLQTSQFQFVFGRVNNSHSRHAKSTSTPFSQHHRSHCPNTLESFIIWLIWAVRWNLSTWFRWKCHHNIAHDLGSQKCLILSYEHRCSRKLYRESNMCLAIWSTQFRFVSYAAIFHFYRRCSGTSSCTQFL